jgi:hypothetical protein
MRTALLLASALVVAVPALAQMREGVPGTLTPPPPPPVPTLDMGAIISDFQKAYASVKQPRLVVFWNKSFGDEVQTAYQDSVRLSNRIQSGSSEFSETTATRFGAARITEREGSAEQTIDASSGTVRLRGPERDSGLGEPVEWRVETGFQDPLLSGGAKLIDRAAIIRTSKDGKAAGERANVQAIETAAIEGKADVILEVLMSADGQSPTGYSYRVDAKDVKTGLVITRFVTQAMPPMAPPQKRYFANDTGFTSAMTEASLPTAEEVGRQLGAETMINLSRAWSARR